MFIFIIILISLFIIGCLFGRFYKQKTKSIDEKDYDKIKSSKTSFIAGTIITCFAAVFFIGISLNSPHPVKNANYNKKTTQVSDTKDSDRYDYAATYSSRKSSSSSKKSYTRVTNIKLLDDIDYYEGKNIKTTIKITSVNSSGSRCAFTAYEYGGYDEVKISVKNIPSKSKPKKGDYITVSGTAKSDSYYSADKITISADKINKTDMSLFREIGSSVKPEIYNSGHYLCGTDIPSGTYVVYPSELHSGYYCISSDANGDDIIANDIFNGQSYCYVEEGQFIELNRCYARPVSQKEDITYENGYLNEGQYLVGDDVPEGTYKLYSTSENSGYFSLTSDANGDNINSNDIFDGEHYVTISSGEYLTLNRCKMKVN